MIKVNVYSIKGTKLSQIALPKNFEEKVNIPLLAQALRVYEDRTHPGTSKTKTRGEVALTKAKWYRQKGTGRARHGAKSAPIFVGGGVAHGPKGVKRQLRLPKKIVQKALNVAFSLKAKEGNVVVVDGISGLKKTKETQKFLDKVFPRGFKKVTFGLSDVNKKANLFIRNIKNASVAVFKDLNAHKVYYGGILILDKKAISKK